MSQKGLPGISRTALLSVDHLSKARQNKERERERGKKCLFLICSRLIELN